MAQRIVLRFTQVLALLCTVTLISCGGGSSSSMAPTPSGGSKVIDPSGNWTMTATDAGNKSVQFAALFAQTGSVVTANSFTAFGNSSPFSCTPFTATLSNGSVQNVSDFTGTVTFGNNFGAFSFNVTLAADGKSFSGTYSNMPSCTGLLLSGTFSGSEVPSTTGSWTGTLQPCTYDQTTAVCTTFGASSPFTAALSQDDATGNVTGTYQVTGVAGFSAGTIAVQPPSDFLSGLTWQFTISDNSGNKATVCGGCTAGANGTGLSGLDLKGNFAGLVVGPSSAYWMVAAH